MKVKYFLPAFVCWSAAVSAAAQREIAPLDYPQPQPHDIVIAGNNLAKAVTCAGNSVYVQGQHNEVQVHGSCKYVCIQGERNHVWVDRATTVPVEGNNNIVFVTNHQTKYSSRGTGNRFERAKH